MVGLDWLLAAWAGHESEADSQGSPLMLKEFKYAVSVEDVSTSELYAWLFTKLARVADVAEIFV